MLSARETAQILEFFQDLPTGDLKALALLISKRNLRPSNRKEAIQIICQHTDSLRVILEKKKISKQYLCQYLHKNKVPITDFWEKSALIRKLLAFWKKPVRQSQPRPANQARNDSFEPPMQISLSSYYKALVCSFCEWFYEIINDQSLSNLKPEHFFSHAKMKINILNGNCSRKIAVTSAANVVQILRELQLAYRLRFAPDLYQNGVEYQNNELGQIMLIVGGTLHSVFNVNHVIGTFKQMFLLLQDKQDELNWKIIDTQLEMSTTQ